ncbi:interferon alpha-inducible protein 27-like protein 2B isoform X2 [Poecilia formosa]|uniref:interferon alpha-inducible protein 27-like protein 2B isoform X2 n=1 Tax=Poecilia formosa TaxID=48698 RepID=UPI0007B7ADB6|nr:PREDICTED: interferon alpha-inducible protein 27-like protein 2B isoform X2 [Poecilia formosa]
MANSTQRQALIFSLQRKLFSLRRDQLQEIASLIDDGPANNLDVLSVPELYNLIVDFIRSEKLSSLEDEGMTQLLLLDDLISDLLASKDGAAGDDPTTPLRTHDASASQTDPQKQQDPPAHGSAEMEGQSPAGSPSGNGKRNFFSGKLFLAGSAVLGGIGAVALAPVVLGAVGFTSAGIAAGSYAASMMSAAAVANGGGVAAGSLVAILQSAGAAGLSGAASAVVASVGAGVGAAVGRLAGKTSTPKREERKNDQLGKEERQK